MTMLEEYDGNIVQSHGNVGWWMFWGRVIAVLEEIDCNVRRSVW